MIRFHCDRCERELTAPDENAGGKMDCPHCGDVNRVPQAPTTHPSGSSSPAVGADPAQARHLPPESAPEQRVMVVRPSAARSHPLGVVILGVLPPAGSIIAAIALNDPGTTAIAAMIAAPILGWVILWAWGFITRLRESLEVTNKRTIHRKGIFSRSTSEVLHDHLRNVEIHQSLADRIFRVGRIGLSSAGQFDIEIEMRGVPNPRRLKDAIDSYRPL